MMMVHYMCSVYTSSSTCCGLDASDGVVALLPTDVMVSVLETGGSVSVCFSVMVVGVLEVDLTVTLLANNGSASESPSKLPCSVCLSHQCMWAHYMLIYTHELLLI